MRINVYGIKSCDTCRKARKWLEAQGIDAQWTDLREQPPARATLEQWLSAVGAEALVNRRSATWRGLDEQQRPALDSPELSATLLEHPTLIKRPLFERVDENHGEFRVGFDDAVRQWLRQG
ncbi:MAG: Spx/MgsR family RNA polymerase-binding regulatory protein [Wenzhouxiangellaceae bacterium]